MKKGAVEGREFCPFCVFPFSVFACWIIECFINNEVVTCVNDEYFMIFIKQLVGISSAISILETSHKKGENGRER